MALRSLTEYEGKLESEAKENIDRTDIFVQEYTDLRIQEHSLDRRWYAETPLWEPPFIYSLR